MHHFLVLIQTRVSNLFKAMQCFSLATFGIKMMVLKLTGEGRMGLEEMVVKPQCGGLPWWHSG